MKVFFKSAMAVFACLIGIVRFVVFGSQRKPSLSPFPRMMHKPPKWPGIFRFARANWIEAILLTIVALLAYVNFAPINVKNRVKENVLHACTSLKVSFIAEELNPKHMVIFEFPATEKFKKQVAEKLKEDCAFLEKEFGVSLNAPILLTVTALEVADGDRLILGHYNTNSPQEHGYATLTVSAPNLLTGTLCHELTHAWINQINPTCPIVINEGVAHYLQTKKEPNESLLEYLEFPRFEIWALPSEFQDDDFKSRAFGYAMAHHLNKEKGWSIREIVTAAPKDLPSAGDVRRCMRNLVMEHIASNALRPFLSILENSSNRKQAELLLFDQGSYTFLRKSNALVGFIGTEQGNSKFEYWSLMNSISWACSYFATKELGYTKEQLEKVTAEELFSLAELSLEMLPKWEEEYSLSVGGQAFDDLDKEFSPLLFTLAKKETGNPQEQEFSERALTLKARGWLRWYYHGKTKDDHPNLNQFNYGDFDFDQFSEQMLEEVEKKQGGPPNLVQRLQAIFEEIGR